MEILFIRHAESEGNKTGHVQDANVPLSSQGREQAKELGKKLASEHIDVLYCSTMKRAKETAELAFGPRKLKTIYLDVIQEKSNGDWEGKSNKEVTWADCSGTFETRHAPGGECLIDVQNRAKEFLKLLKKETHSKIAVVSHGTFIRMLIGHLLGKGIEEITMTTRVLNCSVSRIKFDGKFTVVHYDCVPRKQ